MSLALWFWTLITGSRLKALLYEGRRLKGLERYTQALEIFRRAAEGWPHLPEGFLGLSRTYQAMGLKDEAQREAALGQALERLASHPADPACREQLAEGFMAKGLPHLALEHAEQAHKLGQSSPASLRLIIRVYRANRKHQQALAVLKQALQQEPLDPGLYRQKAVCLKATGEMMEAAKTEALSGALQKQAENPADLDFLQQAVFQLNANNLRPLALQLVDSSLKASPDQAYLHCLRGDLLLDRNEAREAMKSLERAVGLDPLSQRAQWLLSKAYAQQGESDKADLHRDLASRLDAARGSLDPIQGESMLVHVLLESGQADQAQKRAAALAEANPKDWRGAYTLGMVDQRLGKLPEALRCFNRSAQLGPRVARIYLTRAEVYSQMGDPVEAISQARQAVGLAPRDPQVRLGLARILRAHGQFKPAQEEADLAEAMAKRAEGS